MAAQSQAWAVGRGGSRVCWPLAWTERRGQRCSRRWLAAEGEAPGAGLRPEASHGTFNVLVGAQPVPSIECSRSKLKHRQAGGQQGAVPGVRGTGLRAPPPGTLGRRPVVGRGPLTLPTALRPRLDSSPVQAPVLSLLAAHAGLPPRWTRRFEAGQKRAPHGAPTTRVSPVVRAEGTTRTAGPTDTRRLPLLRRLHQASETRQGVAALPDPSRWANATSG